ncbi:hypothetical protein VNI00_017982 [Paramarasmius palmivorus]|uniref:J domain-containing protein n=1 Tax=Paramarasmius palmivorus TaxID=297713 RepID=A0AAW0B3K1_9AGAR
MSLNHNDDDSDADTTFGWNISKLCEAANQVRLAPEYDSHSCEPQLFGEMQHPLPVYQPDHSWYVLLTPQPQIHLKPGLYRDSRVITSQFPNGTPKAGECVLRGADNLDDARRIWRKLCIRYHRDDLAHQAAQEELDARAYAAASLAKAALVYHEIITAYPRFRPRRRRRNDNDVVNDDNTSISAALTARASSTASPIAPRDISSIRNASVRPELDGWHLYVVHANGHRRHLCLEYALASMNSQGSSAPVRIILARSSQRARAVFEMETGIRTELVTHSS